MPQLLRTDLCKKKKKSKASLHPENTLSVVKQRLKSVTLAVGEQERLLQLVLDSSGLEKLRQQFHCWR